MTRRGSLAYYLVAVIVGPLFLSLSIYVYGLLQGDVVSYVGLRFFSAYFLVLIFFALPLLLWAFGLRILSRTFSLREVWQWVMLGGVLLPSMLWVLSAIYLGLSSSGWIPLFFFQLFGGLGLLARESLMALVVILAPAGAATAFLLRRIHLAFEPQAEEAGTPGAPPAR
jgi:hypothetical protein